MAIQAALEIKRHCHQIYTHAQTSHLQSCMLGVDKLRVVNADIARYQPHITDWEGDAPGHPVGGLPNTESEGAVIIW